ncbi:dirigent protein 21-like [Hordeum vulgare subsp. vulgare]|uniref:Dirigent protein n=1 Tax=Hordeum vulgare subsp. vulgare TaxID=112509 RepID=F2CY23_HORVV|nr:dirigent protein 21-like [Hordeum vulgare subsp. vulgare]BAJ87744.1 predicted protein [Hordeum vulgare subsp. vulgare]
MAIHHSVQVMALASLALVAAVAPATTTHLRFYMHDIVTAEAPGAATAVRVVRGLTPLPNDPTNRFGDMYTIDDALTEGAGAASPVIGRAQGFYLFASRTDAALLLSANMVFTAGKHNGSAVAVFARDAILDSVRELPVVGGTGAFRGAAGYGLLRTNTFNATTNNAVLQIDMYLNV